MIFMESKIWDMKTSFIVVGLLCYLAIMMIWTNYHDIHELRTQVPPLMPIINRIPVERFENGKYEKSLNLCNFSTYISFNI